MRPEVFAPALMVLAALFGSVFAQESSQSAAEQAAALSAAARRGDAAAVKALLDAGVDVNTKFRYDVTALSFACDRGHVEVVKLLLERGADPNTTDTFYNASPLTWASSPAQARTPAHAEVVRLLLAHGATGVDPALASAVRAADVPMVEVILDHGGVSDTTLTRVLEMATNAGEDDIVRLLQAAGAKPAPVVTLTAEQLARYPGTYRVADGTGVLVVSLTDGRLVLDASGAGGPSALSLTPRSETQFSAEGGGVDLVFELKDGRAVVLVIGNDRYVRSGGAW